MHRRERSILPALGFAALALAVIALPARAQLLPDQMIYRGLGSDPVDDPGGGPVRLELSRAELPDARTAQVYQLSWWAKIGSAHAAQVALDYVGLEGEESFRYGGGPVSVRWTTRFSLGPVDVALDAATDVPLGDPSLFPLSARAPMGIFRPRVGLLDLGPARVWVGWWARRVSPPSESNRQDPLSGFASGSGYDALMRWRADRFDLEALLHLPTGGPRHRVFHWSAHADWWFAEDLALRVGGGLDTGPRTDRSLDWEVLLGATWRPLREEPEG